MLFPPPVPTPSLAGSCDDSVSSMGAFIFGGVGVGAGDREMMKGGAKPSHIRIDQRL